MAPRWMDPEGRLISSHKSFIRLCSPISFSNRHAVQRKTEIKIKKEDISQTRNRAAAATTWLPFNSGKEEKIS